MSSSSSNSLADDEAAARQAEALLAAGEPVDRRTEEAALRHYRRRDPSDAAVAASLVSCVLLRGGEPDVALMSQALQHYLASPAPMLGVVPFLLEKTGPDAASWESVLKAYGRWLAIAIDPDAVLSELFHLSDGRGEDPGAALSELKAPAPARPRKASSEDHRAFKAEVRRSDYPGVGLFMGLPIPAPPSKHLAARIRAAAHRIASISDVDRPDAEAIAWAVLDRPADSTVADVLDRWGDLPVLPGSAKLVSQDPDEAMNFVWDAFARGAAARDRGLPPIPVFSMAKSGSAFLASVLQHGLDVPAGVVAVGHHIPFGPWLRFALSCPMSIHAHTSVSPRLLGLLAQAGVRRVALQLRDPRQHFLSLAHHLRKDSAPQCEPWKAMAAKSGFTAMLDALIEDEGPRLAAWISGWRAAEQEGQVELGLFKYEAMAADPESHVLRVAEYFRTPREALGALRSAVGEMDKLRRQGGLNHRKGDNEEWREVLTRGQLDRITAFCAEPFAGLYDL